MSEHFNFAQFVTSKAGHDKDQLYVIYAVENEYLYLVDGRLKTVGKPKRKKMKHVQVINYIDKALVRKKENGEAIRDEDIKFAIRKYQSFKG